MLEIYLIMFCFCCKMLYKIFAAIRKKRERHKKRLTFILP